MIWPRRRIYPVRVVPSVRLQGPRTIIRSPLPEDWPQWAEVRERNRAMLTPLEPTWPQDCLSREFFARRLERQMADWQKGRAYSFLIFADDNQSLLGGININNVSRGAAQFASLGYWLDRDVQGQGYMTEALTQVIDFGFKTINLHRFNAGCLPDNEKSSALLRRLGFEEEGLARKYVQIDGKWQDHRLFGLPVEHWSPPEIRS